MNNKFLLSLVISSFSITQAFANVSLKEAYRSAREQNEVIKISMSKTKQTEEKIEQSDASFYPKLNLIGGYTRLGLPEASKNPSNDEKNHYVKFNATQSLFKGFKDIYTVKSTQSDLSSQREQENFTRLNLYSSVAQYFYSILAYESDLKNLEEQKELLSSRVKELSDRVKIGKSRKADLLSAQAQLSSTKAQIELTQAQLQVTREGFANLTSLNVAASLELTPQDFPSHEALEKYLGRIENRPDIISLKRQLESTSQLGEAAKASRLPNLDLAGNYYVDRSGTPSPSKWDVGLTLSLPLYEGGVISSQVREAVAKQSEKSLTLDQARKSAEKEIKTYFETLVANQEQLAALSEAIKNSQAAYQEHLKDYRFGLSTMLDVLQAQNNYLDAKKSYDRLRCQTFLAWAQLLVSTADETLN